MKLPDKSLDRLLSEDLLTLREIATKIEVPPATIRRLVVYGRKSISGENVKLERVRTEQGSKTSVQAVERFRKRLNDDQWDGQY